MRPDRHSSALQGRIRTVATLLALVGPVASPIARLESLATLAGIVVVDDGDARPLRRVIVTLSSAALRTPLITASDDEGRFAFDGLLAGRYTLTAARPGFLTTYYGSTSGWRPPAMPISLTADSRIEDLVVRMKAGSVITGQVTDEYGRPFPGANVIVSGVRGGRLDSAPAPGMSQVVTDDRGIYRAYGLPPGSYVVGADWPSRERRSVQAMEPFGRPIGYVPVFYPGSANVGALQPVALASAEERTGVDIVMRPVLMATVSGRVIRADGSSAGGLTIGAMPARALPGRAANRPVTTATARDGEFTFRGLPPATYVIGVSTRMSPDDKTSAWAQVEVEVRERDVSDLTLQLRPALTLRGRVTVGGGGELPADALRTTVTLAPIPANDRMRLVEARPAADGTFEIGHLLPGRYGLRVAVPAAVDGPKLMVASATADGLDLMTNPLDLGADSTPPLVAVVLTDMVTELSGRLLDRKGQSAPEYHVMVFPADRRVWALGESRLRESVRPGTDGVYRVWGLQPGTYYLAAVTDLQPGDHADPEFLERLVPGAITISIAAGERTIQDVQLASGR